MASPDRTVPSPSVLLLLADLGVFAYMVRACVIWRIVAMRVLRHCVHIAAGATACVKVAHALAQLATAGATVDTATMAVGSDF